jgi:hypothetical protein
MAEPIDYVPIRLTCADEKYGRKQMREMLGKSWWRKRGRASWAGFAAERAICRAVNAAVGDMWCEPSPILAYDLALGTGQSARETLSAGGEVGVSRVEVKTRTVTKGWTHPSKFNFVTIPMHQDREPIKDVDLVILCWYSMSAPRRLWVLGYIRGRSEFDRRSVFYRGGEPLPRGGWAKGHGAYVVETAQMRPIPRGMLKGDDE